MELSTKIDLIDINYDCIFETEYQQSRKYNKLKDKYAKLQINHISNIYEIKNLQKQIKQMEKQNNKLENQLKEIEDTQKVLQTTIAQLLHKIMM